ncbi:MAG: hypothetical protein ABI210_08380 [Abditibacteriaceae bacterium]
MSIKSTFWLCGALLLGWGSATPASALSQTAKKAFVWNIVESSGIKHGDIYLVYSDNTKKQITTKGSCSNPQVAADGKTVGWREGEFLEYREQTPMPYWETSIALYSNDKRLKSVGPFENRSLIGKWYFAKQGKQVALRRYGMHGQPVYMLWDVFGGQASSSWEEYDDDGKKLLQPGLPGLRNNRIKVLLRFPS